MRAERAVLCRAALRCARCADCGPKPGGAPQRYRHERPRQQRDLPGESRGGSGGLRGGGQVRSCLGNRLRTGTFVWRTVQFQAWCGVLHSTCFPGPMGAASLEGIALFNACRRGGWRLCQRRCTTAATSTRCVCAGAGVTLALGGNLFYYQLLGTHSRRAVRVWRSRA